MTDAMLASAAVIALMMLSLWLVSLAIANVSIVDIAWGPGFALAAWASVLAADGAGPRPVLIAALASAWGLRLGIHLARRNLGHGEDFRYAAMRRRHGAAFRVRSLATVFGFQALLMWVISLPLQAAASAASPDHLTALDALGIAVFAVGLGFEAVGDEQLRRFKADPQNAGRVMDQGLWAWTRHPNYFGDATAWWGLWLIAAATGEGALTVVSPLVMTWLLVRVSGAALLERSLRRRRPGYEEYVARTSAFLPRRPRDR